MLKIIETQTKKSKSIWIGLILLSACFHGGAFYLMEDWAESKPREVFDSSTIEFQSVEKEPVPVIDPIPEPMPEPLPEPEKKVVVKKKIHKSNTSKVAPEPSPETPSAQPVFGATKDSVVAGDSGVSIRVGNTLSKTMEKEFIKPTKVKAITAPPTPVEAVEAPVVKKAPVVPVPVFELTTAPSFKKKVEPSYPDEAKRQEIEGVVQLEVLIDATGKVRKVKVLKSPGFGLERAAISAVSKSRFNPGIMNGRAVPVKIKIPYRFVLSA